MQDFSIYSTELIFYKMQAFQLVTILLCNICLCKRTTAIGTHTIDEAAEFPARATCPDTWFVPSHSGECQCGHTFHGVVSCNEDTKEVRVLDCFCMTFDTSRNKTVVGECLYNCLNTSKSNSNKGCIYHPVPRDLAKDGNNNSVCGYLHRTGTLCGECVDNYFQPAYSYAYHCIYCDRSQWLIYLAVAYVPLTMFIVFILVFRVSVVSPKLYGMVSLLQTLALPLNIRALQEYPRHNMYFHKTLKLLIAALSIWNLDFFRSLLPNICLRISPLENLALDYLIAVYPMIVTVVAFMIVQLYYCGFHPIFFICRPFQRVFANFRQGWNLQTTLIDAFITFFILSTTKIFHVSVGILLSVQLHDAEGNSLGYYWYENPTFKVFDSEHRPYAILAMTALTFLIVLPIALLVCYQFSFSQVCLSKTRIKRQILEDFMHSFNKYYKDGSEGTWDCRWFAAFHILNRLGFYLLLFSNVTGMYYFLAQLYSLLCSVIVLLVEPYKNEFSFYNCFEPCVYLFLTLILVGVTGINYSIVASRVYNTPLFVITGLSIFVPVIYLFVLTIWWIYKNTCVHFKLSQQSMNVTSTLPDRLVHSGNYNKSITHTYS